MGLQSVPSFLRAGFIFIFSKPLPFASFFFSRTVVVSRWRIIVGAAR